MPVDDGLQRLGECLQTRLIRKGELHLHHIRVALSGGNVMVQNALLQRSQRVDVLHIGGTSRYCVQQLVDGCLIKLHQRQHLRSDLLAALRNAIGGQRQCAAFAVLVIALFDEFYQRRLVLAQVLQQTVFGQCTAIALHNQLSVLDRQVNSVSFECRQ
ncbi:hypothetical protein Pta6605_29030 [Pseudomonas amygdali pv. tabaci]|nr:hypothetical protein Pta6605_29030 [Pseudomonas amygdali pv. tabaci]